MANTPDLATCMDGDSPGGPLPLSPFSALSYHFGMLLGVDDFETEQAYHRAKHRLHNAWLHREGVVWGFGVNVDSAPGEIRVKPGLGLDSAGHELHLEADACLNVGKWFDKHERDPNFNVETTSDVTKRFDAHVVIRFKACLTRQVPALMEPCNNGGSGTAYSRVFETVEILLRPGIAPSKRPPYHRLRLLFGLETADTEEGGAVKEGDQQVLDARTAVQALPAGDRPVALMAAFHRFAALDEIDLEPARSEDDARTLLFPGREYEPVALANVNGLTLTKANGDWVLSGGEVDTSVRPSHVATTTIQDLLCGPLFAAPELESAGDNGPRVDPKSVILLNAKSIIFNVNKELHEGSVQPAGFSVTWFVPERGWQRSNVETASYGGGETKTVTLDLDSEIRGRVRLIVFGTGPTPLLGADLVPLAGGFDGPPGTPHNGHDFVHMQDLIEASIEPAPGTEPERPSVETKEESSEDANTDEGSRRFGQRGKIRRSKSAK